jgi:hypothetical protein
VYPDCGCARAPDDHHPVAACLSSSIHLHPSGPTPPVLSSLSRFRRAAPPASSETEPSVGPARVPARERETGHLTRPGWNPGLSGPHPHSDRSPSYLARALTLHLAHVLSCQRRLPFFHPARQIQKRNQKTKRLRFLPARHAQKEKNDFLNTHMN